MSIPEVLLAAAMVLIIIGVSIVAVGIDRVAERQERHEQWHAARGDDLRFPTMAERVARLYDARHAADPTRDRHEIEAMSYHPDPYRTAPGPDGGHDDR